MGHISIRHQDDDFIVQMPNVIDETTDFPQEKPRLSQRVIIECGHIDIVNSFGMHKWIIWMRTQPPETQYVFQNCHRKVIDMMNAVEGFLFDNAVVESFYMPYYCSQCDGEDEILLKRGKDFVESTSGQKPRLLYPNQLNCPKCRNSMDVGIMENVYLRFLQREK